jgi:hypothetical protein
MRGYWRDRCHEEGTFFSSAEEDFICLRRLTRCLFAGFSLEQPLGDLTLVYAALRSPNRPLSNE